MNKTIYSAVAPDGTVRWSKDSEALERLADKAFVDDCGPSPVKAKVAFSYSAFMEGEICSSCRCVYDYDSPIVRGIDLIMHWLNDDADEDFNDYEYRVLDEME